MNCQIQLICWACCQNIAVLHKSEERFNVMIAIVTPFPDMQGKV
jgi:hypothetical protein